MAADEWDRSLPAQLADWQVEDHPIVDSTQPLAAARPAWTAVFAQQQRLGRGQRERTFVSDAGGLYVSAVLPYAGDALRARGFSLAVGWALHEAICALGVRGARLRWPNDLMLGARKLGGILVEQGRRDTLLVGVGLNVRNCPWQEDPTLAPIADVLARHVRELPKRETLAAAVLQAIRTAHEQFAAFGFAGLVERVNVSWGPPRPVELDLTEGGEPVRGTFAGIAVSGDLKIRVPGGAFLQVPEHHVARLREPTLM
jgi:BirA family biotin operon repressor/biotin-[acetyl-CoA-carboxylase] ligase